MHLEVAEAQGQGGRLEEQAPQGRVQQVAQALARIVGGIAAPSLLFLEENEEIAHEKQTNLATAFMHRAAGRQWAAGSGRQARGQRQLGRAARGAYPQAPLWGVGHGRPATRLPGLERLLNASFAKRWCRVEAVAAY